MTERVAWGAMLRHLEPYLKASMERPQDMQ